MKDDTERPTLKAIVALLKYAWTVPKNTQLPFHRLSNWDPDVFYKFRDPILNRSPLVQLNCEMIFAVIYLNCGVSISCWIKTKTWLLRHRAGRWLCSVALP